MDKATLNLLMNFHKLGSSSVDLSSVIARVLREEKVNSGGGPAGDSQKHSNGFKDKRPPRSLNDETVLKKCKIGKHLQAKDSSFSTHDVTTASKVKSESNFAGKEEPVAQTLENCLSRWGPHLEHCKRRTLVVRDTTVEDRQTSSQDTDCQPTHLVPLNRTKDNLVRDIPPNPSAADVLKCYQKEDKACAGPSAAPLSENSRPSSPVQVVDIGVIDGEDCETVINSLVAANNFFVEIPKHMNSDKLREEQSIYLSKKKHDESKSQGPHSKEVRAAILQVTLGYLEMKIVEIVKFAKRIPGFTALSLDDQAALVKESRTESAIIGGMRLINSESKVFSTRCGQHFTIDEMNAVFSTQFLEQKVAMCKQIKRLCLSQEEETLLRAISITFSDRSKLDNPVAVQNIQNMLMSCLVYSIKRTGKYEVGVRLGQLIGVLVNLRDVTEVDMKQVKKLLLESPAYTNSPVVKEFL